MEESIELRELFAILFKRKWFIIIITLIFLGFGVFYSQVMVTPMYQSSTTLMVNGSKGLDASGLASGFDLSSFSRGGEIVITYSEIVKSRIVLEQVIAQLELNMSYRQLLSMTAARQVGTTEILNISVTDIEPNRAEKIANTISSVFIKEVMRILKVDNVEVIDAAIPMPEPINIRTFMNIAISTILGMMLAMFLSFVIHYLDRSVKSEEDVEKHIKLPVFGTIPEYSRDMKKGQMKELIVHNAPKSPISEAYRGIRTNLIFANVDNNVKTILASSATSSEGKTTTLCNLAMTLADSNKNVIIVDCDLRKPRIHKFMDISNAHGVTDVLLRGEHYSNFLHKGIHPHLHVITSGRIPGNPSEIMNSDAMKLLINTLREDYDYVLIDTPPIIPVTDTLIMSTYIDRVLLVCASGDVDIDMANKAKEKLEKVGAKILGVVLNKVKMNSKKYQYYYHYTSDTQ